MKVLRESCDKIELSIAFRGLTFHVHPQPLPIAPGDRTLVNTNELILSVTRQTNLPADQVEKVSHAVLRKFSELIESQGSFQSPILQVVSLVSAAKPASDGKPATPERKFAHLRIPPSKAKG
jgi:hypothetical protein